MARARVQAGAAAAAAEHASAAVATWHRKLYVAAKRGRERGHTVSCCWSWPLRRRVLACARLCDGQWASSAGARGQQHAASTMESLQYLAIYLFLRLHMLATVSEIAFSSIQSNYLQLPQGVRCQCVRCLFRIVFSLACLSLETFIITATLSSKSP